ncbi:leucine-rich repeat domain-containing protein [Fluviicola sp.]|uniref:leucine-rich repeat domain-containing protein n=1 Tax=Fluviicola sp. TaxID=1917219 RepID=UPI0026080BD5|nr:leucine-rich repeat domain-containing protein [Fluviicola sp.]
MTEAELKKQLQSTNPLEIEEALLHGSHSAGIKQIIDLFESIWKMTYAASSDSEFKAVRDGSLAHKIVLMNEQEDLIPAALSGVEEVTALDLGGFPEAAFFPELLRYKKLQKLQFWENEVSVLPDGFFELSHLRELYLSCNLEELSPLIEKLQELRILVVSGNQIKQIPASIQKLGKLEELDVSNNQLTELPAFLAELPSLKILHIYGNPDLVVNDPAIYREKGIELVD